MKYLHNKYTRVYVLIMYMMKKNNIVLSSSDSQ